MDTETKILLGLIALFSAGATAALRFDQPEVITAISLSLAITACLYRFLGGIEGSRLAVASFKAGGSVAVFFAALWFVESKLAEARPPVVHPASTEWMAVDRTGVPIDVTIDEESHGSDTSLLADAVWSTVRDAGEIRAAAGHQTLARIDLASLGSVGLFNQVRTPDGLTIHVTDELPAGAIADLFPPYPFWLQTSRYQDNYNGYTIIDRKGDIVDEGFLITKNFKFFKHDGKHFLVFVSRAVHSDAEQEPYAVFGFAQLDVSVGNSSPE